MIFEGSWLPSHRQSATVTLRRGNPRLRLGSLVASLLFLASVSWLPGAEAAAPARTGQPYAEDICNSDPNIIFCEDFNYPTNFVAGPDGTYGNSNWINPGLTTGFFGFVYGLQGRRINPTSTYPAKPQGAMPSGTQPDHVWVANWDPAKGEQGNGSTWGKLREPGGRYANGSQPASDFYIRFQYYVTPNYAWPGDPRSDKYVFGSGSQCYDNKIFYAFPPEGTDNPTNSAYSAGLSTQCGVFDPVNVARYADALTVRYGDTSDNYKWTPACSVCSSTPAHYEYSYQCTANNASCWRDPHDVPKLGSLFRFDTGKWYTVEYRYKLSSASGRTDGLVEVWIDGTKVYSITGLATCGGGLGDCSGVGAINVDAYHNGLDRTKWNGQQVIDNLIVSRSYIGLPRGGSQPPAPAPAPTGVPSPPTNLRVQ
jgi:hypothetical protein